MTVHDKCLCGHREKEFVMEEYQGWTNRHTWIMALWINNEESLYEECKSCSNAKQIQDVIEEDIESAYPSALWGGNFVADLLGYDLAIIDWGQIYNRLHEE